MNQLIATPVRKEDRSPRAAGPAASYAVRPRTAGEILDDACRLALTDAPLLLALSGLFTVPAAVAVLLLLALPIPSSVWEKLVVPGIVAVLLPLTALGSAACQAAFRRRAEGQTPLLVACLKTALARGLGHVAAQSLVWAVTVVGAALPAGALALWIAVGSSSAPGWVQVLWLAAALFIWQSVTILAGSTGVHPLLAGGEKNGFAAWWKAVRWKWHLGKSAAVALCRPALLLMTMLNLLLFVGAALWVGELAGVDTALIAVILEADRVFRVAVGLFAWLLMFPFAEASNYLLCADAQARYEGLDLWYRVRRLFPSGQRPAVVLALALAAGLLAPAPAHADQRLDSVRTARRELARIVQEVKTTEPYVNGNRWTGPLQELAARLEREGSARPEQYRWVTQALVGFQRRLKDDALQVLAGIDRRLAAIEHSLAPPAEGPGSGRSKADIKSLLPPAPEEDSPVSAPTTKPREAEQRPQPPPEEDPFEQQPRRTGRQGTGAVGPSSSGGFSSLVWILLAATLAAVLVTALVLYQRRRPAPKPPAPAAAPAPADALSLEALLNQARGEGLWRQADELAQRAQFSEAVRTLYLAVLALLHRGDLIRYNPTRTNGEYVRQLRDKANIQRPFRGLTGLFEVKWYGARSCLPAEYDTCRRLADQVRLATTATEQS